MLSDIRPKLTGPYADVMYAVCIRPELTVGVACIRPELTGGVVCIRPELTVGVYQTGADSVVCVGCRWCRGLSPFGWSAPSLCLSWLVFLAER